MLWRLFLLMPDPQAREPKVGLRALTPMRKFLWWNYFPVSGSLQMYGIWLYHKCAPPITLWFLVFGCRVPFWKVSVFFIYGCIELSCDSDILMGGSKLKFFYSAILFSLLYLQELARATDPCLVSTVLETALRHNRYLAVHSWVCSYISQWQENSSALLD